MNFEEEITKKIVGENPEEQYENAKEEVSVENITSKISKDDVFAKDKKSSSVNEVVSRSADEKEEAENIFRKLFSEYQDDLKEYAKGKELKKSEEQARLIEFVDEETNKLLEKYGLEKFNVKLNNVHLFSKVDTANLFGKKIEDESVPLAVCYWHLQAVFLNQKEGYDKLSFSHAMFHELTHFKEYQKLYAKNDNISDSNNIEGDEEDLLKKISEDKEFFKKYNLIQHGISLVVASDSNKYKEYMFENRKNIPNAKDFRLFSKLSG